MPRSNESSRSSEGKGNQDRGSVVSGCYVAARFDSMIRSRRTRGRLLALLLGFQGVGVWAPLADARLEGPAPAVHIEERGSDDCPRAHVHGDCALCHHLTHRHAVVGVVAVVLPLAQVSRRPAPSAQLDASGRDAPTARGRSPPLV